MSCIRIFKIGGTFALAMYDILAEQEFGMEDETFHLRVRDLIT